MPHLARARSLRGPAQYRGGRGCGWLTFRKLFTWFGLPQLLRPACSSSYTPWLPLLIQGERPKRSLLSHRRTPLTLPSLFRLLSDRSLGLLRSPNGGTQPDAWSQQLRQSAPRREGMVSAPRAGWPGQTFPRAQASAPAGDVQPLRWPGRKLVSGETPGQPVSTHNLVVCFRSDILS